MAADLGASVVSSLLHEVASRLGPRVPLCPVDFSCPFTVCDLAHPDYPIVDASRPFELLTGYSRQGIVGRNCRFLQHPDGREDVESRQLYTDLSVVSTLKSAILARAEVQVCLINYRKGGHPFLNALTVIPVGDRYALGFQIDTVDSPSALGTGPSTSQNPESRRVDYRTAPSIPAAVGQAVLDNLGALVQRASPFNVNSADDAWRVEDFYAHRSAGDVVFALSSKATIAYVSPSSAATLGFLPTELIYKSFSALCHPSDVIDLFRSFAGGAPSGSLSVAFRMRLKSGGYIWIDAMIQPGRDVETGISYILIVVRKHDMVPIAPEDSPSERDLAWAKVTPTGLILHMSVSIKDILLRRADELQGTTIHSLASTNPPSDLSSALMEASCGKRVTSSHLLLDKRNRRTPVTVTLDAGEPVAVGHGTQRRASFVVVRISRDRTDSIKAYLARDNEALGSSADSPIPQPGADAPSLTVPRSWHSELRALQAANSNLARQLNQMMAVRRRHRRRKHAAGACQQCGRTESPEWRRGPGGANTLCNPCGIKWAKGSPQTDNRTKRSASGGSKDADISGESASASPRLAGTGVRSLSGSVASPSVRSGGVLSVAGAASTSPTSSLAPDSQTI